VTQEELISKSFYADLGWVRHSKYNPEVVAQEMDAWAIVKRQFRRNAYKREHAKTLNKLHRRFEGKSPKSGLAYGFLIWLQGRAVNCYYCGQRHLSAQRDHLVPITKEGSDSITNLQAACKKCNSSKGDKTELEYISRRIWHGLEVARDTSARVEFLKLMLFVVQVLHFSEKP